MRTRTLLFVVVLAVAVALPASAADRGFYVGAGIGIPSYDIGDFYAEYEQLRFEEDTFGFKVFGGFRIFRNFAVEAGITDYGSISRRETDIILVDQKLSVGVDAWDLTAVGIVPLGRKANLFGKAGWASWNADVKLTLDDEVEDRSQDGTDLTFGAGLDFFFNHVGIRLELDWLNMENTDGAFMFSGCLTYRF